MEKRKDEVSLRIMTALKGSASMLSLAETGITSTQRGHAIETEQMKTPTLALLIRSAATLR